jgi:DNA-binding GntR family transcriptional regulator
MDTSVNTSRLSLGEAAYIGLRTRLLSGELSPDRRLVESRLTDLLKVSRTPLREALVRLAADGLVNKEQDGYYPSRPDLSQLRDLYELRITLELRGISRAIDNAGLHHDIKALIDLRETWRGFREDPPAASPDVVLLDEDFHLTLSAAAGNLAITDALRSVNTRIRRVRMYDYLTEDRVWATIVEHLEILDLVIGDELPAALTAMHKHVGASYEVVEERAARAIAAHALGRPLPS